jgi:hypothetical protein
MGVVAPPPAGPFEEQDEFEALIREARARQRKRWTAAAVVAALLAGTALGMQSIVTGPGRSPAVRSRGATPALGGRSRCGVTVVGSRILAGDGSVTYREPYRSSMWHEVRCSGSTVWVVFVNGVGMMHQAYVGVRSPDRGRTWRVAFAQDPRVHARYGIGAEVGPLAVVGRQAAYFVGTCPACSVGNTFGTVSLTVTKDGGRTFHTYPVPALNRFEPSGLRVTGKVVTIVGKRIARLVNRPPFRIYRHETVKVRVS